MGRHSWHVVLILFLAVVLFDSVASYHNSDKEDEHRVKRDGSDEESSPKIEAGNVITSLVPGFSNGFVSMFNKLTDEAEEEANSAKNANSIIAEAATTKTPQKSTINTNIDDGLDVLATSTTVDSTSSTQETIIVDPVSNFALSRSTKFIKYDDQNWPLDDDDYVPLEKDVSAYTKAHQNYVFIDSKQDKNYSWLYGESKFVSISEVFFHLVPEAGEEELVNSVFAKLSDIAYEEDMEVVLSPTELKALRVLGNYAANKISLIKFHQSRANENISNDLSDNFFEVDEFLDNLNTSYTAMLEKLEKATKSGQKYNSTDVYNFMHSRCIDLIDQTVIDLLTEMEKYSSTGCRLSSWETDCWLEKAYVEGSIPGSALANAVLSVLERAMGVVVYCGMCRRMIYGRNLTDADNGFSTVTQLAMDVHKRLFDWVDKRLVRAWNEDVLDQCLEMISEQHANKVDKNFSDKDTPYFGACIRYFMYPVYGAYFVVMPISNELEIESNCIGKNQFCIEFEDETTNSKGVMSRFRFTDVPKHWKKIVKFGMTREKIQKILEENGEDTLYAMNKAFPGVFKNKFAYPNSFTINVKQTNVTISAIKVYKDLEKYAPVARFQTKEQEKSTPSNATILYLIF